MTAAQPSGFTRHPALDVRELGGKGRGVVAATAIRAGELLEVAPVIPLRSNDQPDRSSVLFDYPFRWDDPPFVEAIALGVLSMVNHSSTPNADFEPDIANKVVRLFAISDIAAGEEITFDYIIPLWFEAEA